MGNCNRRLPCSKADVIIPDGEFVRDETDIILVTEAELDERISALEKIKANRYNSYSMINTAMSHSL